MYNTENSIVLTEKQIKILDLCSKGLTDYAIALELGISISTVKYHKRRFLCIFNTNSTIETIAKAIRTGILKMET